MEDKIGWNNDIKREFLIVMTSITLLHLYLLKYLVVSTRFSNKMFTQSGLRLYESLQVAKVFCDQIFVYFLKNFYYLEDNRIF
jgi:hypothetical protein